MKEYLPQLFYTVVPKKGYSIRCTSKEFLVKEYEETIDKYYLPIEPSKFLRENFEGNMVACSRYSKNVFFSRIYNSVDKKLDEKGRGGVISHTVQVPVSLLKKNLSFYTIVEALRAFDHKNESYPIGEIDPLEIEWDENQNDVDIANLKSLVSRNSIQKVFEALASDKRVYLLAKGNRWDDRTKIVHGLAKLLVTKTNMQGYIILSELPLQFLLERAFTHIVVASILVHLKPNSSYAVIKTLPEGEQAGSPIEKEKIDQIVSEIYNDKQNTG
ncbi:MAG: hypothetical protein ACP5UL_05210 [Thermoplasmata archaeon]